MVKIRSHSIVRLMINATRWIISRLKLLKLPQTMQTARGKQLAQHNAQFLVEFMAKLSAELAGENEGVDHKVIDAFSPAG